LFDQINAIELLILKLLASCRFKLVNCHSLCTVYAYNRILVRF